MSVVFITFMITGEINSDNLAYLNETVKIPFIFLILLIELVYLVDFLVKH